MYYEQTAQFSSAQAVTTTADATNVYDVCGTGVGNAPGMIGPGGLNTNLGSDIGAIRSSLGEPTVVVNVTTAGTGAGTITISLSAAADNGSFSNGTYQILTSTQAFVGTSLKLGQTIILPVPPFPQPNETTAFVKPRFYKLTYTVSGSATASFTSNLVINAPTRRDAQIYGENYTVAS